MQFPYSQYPAGFGKTIYRPSIPILFRHGIKFIFVEALIDSGADYSILPIEIAGELGLTLDTKVKRNFLGAGSNPFPVYASKIKIEHILRQSGFRPISWKAEVYFAESQPTILLGNHGFLDRLKVTLHGRRREVEISK